MVNVNIETTETNSEIFNTLNAMGVTGDQPRNTLE